MSVNDTKNFLDSADSRETSPEIMAAIWQVAMQDETEAVRVWESPMSGELVAIVEIVTGNGRRQASGYQWGANGSRWAEVEV